MYKQESRAKQGTSRWKAKIYMAACDTWQKNIHVDRRWHKMNSRETVVHLHASGDPKRKLSIWCNWKGNTKACLNEINKMKWLKRIFTCKRYDTAPQFGVLVFHVPFKKNPLSVYGKCSKGMDINCFRSYFLRVTYFCHFKGLKKRNLMFHWETFINNFGVTYPKRGKRTCERDWASSSPTFASARRFHSQQQSSRLLSKPLPGKTVNRPFPSPPIKSGTGWVSRMK